MCTACVQRPTNVIVISSTTTTIMNACINECMHKCMNAHTCRAASAVDTVLPVMPLRLHALVFRGFNAVCERMTPAINPPQVQRPHVHSLLHVFRLWHHPGHADPLHRVQPRAVQRAPGVYSDIYRPQRMNEWEHGHDAIETIGSGEIHSAPVTSCAHFCIYTRTIQCPS